MSHSKCQSKHTCLKFGMSKHWLSKNVSWSKVKVFFSDKYDGLTGGTIFSKNHQMMVDKNAAVGDDS